MLTLNPLAYRGYFYDVYTGLYYLQSRFYNPMYGRFLNADSQISTSTVVSANIFAYCENSPIQYVDVNGKMPSISMVTFSTLYVMGEIGALGLLIITLISTWKAPFTGFHQFAQMLIGAKLFKDNLPYHFEVNVGTGRADVVSGNSVWEVKPLSGDAESQLYKYTHGTGYKRGTRYVGLETVNLTRKLDFNISFDGNGGAYYFFSLNGVTLSNKEAYAYITEKITVIVVVIMVILLLLVAIYALPSSIGIAAQLSTIFYIFSNLPQKTQFSFA